MTQATTPNTASPNADVRPQRPRPAPPRPGFVEPPTAWDCNSRRAVLLAIALSFALFVFACLLFSRLTTGGYVHFAWPPHFELVPLGQLMVDPHISIYRVPEQAIVLALLLAVFVVVPIVTSQFVGRAWAMAFLVPLSLLAPLPLLATAMLPAVWLARSRILGLVNRFLRGVVALVFPVAALWLSTAWTDFVPQGPMDRFYLHVPWGGAIVIAMIGMLSFWLTARLLKYRAVVGAALLIVLVGLAVGTFLLRVGEDELAFLPFRDSGNPTYLEPGAMTSRQYLEQSRRVTGQLCAEFIARYPSSRYVPYVLYRQACSQDLQCPRGSRECSWWPVSHATETWQRLVTRHPDHPLAIIARVRLARSLAATSQPGEACALLDDAAASLRKLKPAHPHNNLAEREPVVAVHSIIEPDIDELARNPDASIRERAADCLVAMGRPTVTQPE